MFMAGMKKNRFSTVCIKKDKLMIRDLPVCVLVQACRMPFHFNGRGLASRDDFSYAPKSRLEARRATGA